MSERALGLMWTLRIPDGRRWGDVAAPFQMDDAEAIFADDGPRWHYLTRPRGGSKTTDLAAVALSWLMMDAPPLAQARVIASAKDQAEYLVDAARSFINDTPALKGRVVIENEKIVAESAAYVRVMSMSDSASWGLRDTHLIVVDEFAQWPDTRKSRVTWQAIYSTLPKPPRPKLVILTSAGEPSHFSYGVMTRARAGKSAALWRISEVPGPIPWVSHDFLEGQAEELGETTYARLHLNQWTEDEDRLVTPEQLDDACVLKGPLPPQRGVRYVITADIGVKVDPTAIAVCHAEPKPDNPRTKRLVVDDLVRFIPRRNKEVQLGVVETVIERLSKLYHRAPVHGDPSQFHQMRQNLTARGVRVSEYKFSSPSVGELASALVLALQNRQCWLPDRDDLRTELGKVRLRSMAPGTYRLDHDAGAHDDQAVVLGMAAHLLLGGLGGVGRGWLEYLHKRKDEQDANPPSLAEQISPRQFFVGQDAPPPPSRRCEHRWFPDGRCVHCGANYPEVMAMEQARLAAINA